MEKVSIIIPVYNVEKYIKKCVESVVNQSYSNLEVIIVNDGTKDDSITKINEIIEKDNRIILLEKENGGLSSARNYGLDYATGKYIAFLDSDDYIDENMIKKMVNKLESENLDFVEINYYYLYEENNTKKKAPLLMYDNKNEFLAKGRVNVSNKLYKKEIIDKSNLRFQNGVYYEDIGFTNKYVLNSKNIGYINYEGYYYLQRSNSIIGSKNPKGKLDIIDVFEDLIKYYKDNNLYNKYHSELEYLVSRIILGSSFKRIIDIEDKDIRLEYIEKTYKFLKLNFPDYKNNIYLNKKSTLSSSKLRLKENLKNYILKRLNIKLLKFIAKIKF